ncbi:unnamed protein product [Phytophthora fragariaefolia]|uniref:Unnamed protein product n=1 Tax=Phytophthora fragariaefolia TaxID=1490495 RepID=A0A9W7D6M4_9STRA|nr:unnamed protein product [Phytophthora fragariaefolia]
MGKYEYSWLVYEHMERVYASKDTVSIYHARASFHNLKYKDGDDMQFYINDLDEKTETLARLGRPIDDEEKVMHMLGSLPDSWKNLVMVCQNQKELKWRDLQTKLLLEIDTRKHSSITTDLQAHLANVVARLFTANKSRRARTHINGMIRVTRASCAIIAANLVILLRPVSSK